MMYNFPFFPHFYPRPYNAYPHFNNINNKSMTNRRNPNIKDRKNYHYEEKKEINEKKSEPENEPVFEILGIKLYSDDILLICLIFFLYNEGVKDEFLFVALVLLLLS